MLVLTRKQGERVRIGKNIYVDVVRIDANRVKLGISAPKSVRVVRGELQLFDNETPRCEGNDTG